MASPPTHVIDVLKQITCIELSPYEWSQNVVLIAVQEKIILGLIKFPEETESSSFEWTLLKELFHEHRCDSIALAAESSLSINPKCIMFATAGSDFNVRIFRSDLANKDTVQLLQGHTNYINEVSWDPDGDYLASVSDDHCCIIWSSRGDFETSSIFYLSTAGMSVKWHPDKCGKILVAEKKGLVHLYNVRTQQTILTIESPKSTLMSADWSISKDSIVSAIASGEIYTWNLKKPCRPIESRAIHEDGGIVAKISPNNEYIIASVGRPNLTLKVTHSKSQMVLLEVPIKLFGGISWHYRLPYVAVAIDRKLCFWKIHIK